MWSDRFVILTLKGFVYNSKWNDFGEAILK